MVSPPVGLRVTLQLRSPLPEKFASHKSLKLVPVAVNDPFASPTARYGFTKLRRFLDQSRSPTELNRAIVAPPPTITSLVSAGFKTNPCPKPPQLPGTSNRPHRASLPDNGPSFGWVPPSMGTIGPISGPPASRWKRSK